VPAPPPPPNTPCFDLWRWRLKFDVFSQFWIQSETVYEHFPEVANAGHDSLKDPAALVRDVGHDVGKVGGGEGSWVDGGVAGDAAGGFGFDEGGRVLKLLLVYAFREKKTSSVSHLAVAL
jgi:hypothetical protein